MNETIQLDGRKFHSVSQSLTASQDDYILAHLRLSGAIEVLNNLDGAKRTQEERAQDLLTRIMLSGRMNHILAGCLTEEGKAWTRKEADANAELFGAITDSEEKTARRTAVVEFVAGFFSSGAPSSEISPRSSSRSGKVPHTKSAAQTSGTSRH